MLSEEGTSPSAFNKPGTFSAVVAVVPVDWEMGVTVSVLL